ncbi:cell division cycle 5-like protein [Dorcoceras hygrometricum]|uniref:Cell division cycle 5-like protein n=1 Tax=Dorcoceras hygrometricum TaxID=472368 RepID=A0A2Z7D905_9LAMI|nr:cell division cycle 5-like protein [Dorcoceras hygrometricum]
MSLFDLQDVCIAIGSLATLDLPMVVDLIGIYGLKGSYCTLTTTNWFFQALSVIPRGSWRDVARRFTMIRWASLLVQADEGTLLPVVDLIRRNLPPPTVKCRFPRETGRSQAPRRQQDGIWIRHGFPTSWSRIVSANHDPQKAPGSDYFSNGNNTSLVAPNQIHLVAPNPIHRPDFQFLRLSALEPQGRFREHNLLARTIAAKCDGGGGGGRGISRNAKNSRRNVLSIQSQEDSGEAFDEQDASNSSIQSKSLFESAVAIYSVARYSVQSQEIQAQRIEEVAKRSSRNDKSAAK